MSVPRDRAEQGEGAPIPLFGGYVREAGLVELDPSVRLPEGEVVVNFDKFSNKVSSTDGAPAAGLNLDAVFESNRDFVITGHDPLLQYTVCTYSIISRGDRSSGKCGSAVMWLNELYF